MTADDRPSDGQRLESWKAIAVFLNRDVRTVMRWEKSEGLPVHRHQHQAGRSVHAFGVELEAWQNARRLPAATIRVGSTRSWNLIVAALCFVVSVGTVSDARLDAPFSVADRPLGWPDDASMTADASMSADGRYVSFVDETTDELGIRDLRTGRQWPLTKIAAAGGWMEGSTISRDSRFVAFASGDKGPNYTSDKLRVLPLDAPAGTVPRVVAQGQRFQPMQWSTDDRELLVRVERQDQRVDIGIVDVAAANYRRVREFSRPFPGDIVRWSPDATSIAYDTVPTLGAGHRDIHVMSARDGVDVSVTTGPSSDSVVGWSPDGRHLLFQSDRGHRIDLWAMPMSGGRAAGDPVLIREDLDAEPHAITARGDLFYERAVGASGGPLAWALMTATVDPVNGTLVTRPWFATRARGALDRFPRWSADGTQFLYVTRWRTGSSLSIQSLSLQQTRELPLGLGYIWTLDWAPDGRWLALHAKDLAGRSGIFLLDVSTGRLEMITPERHDSVTYGIPQFTPDGKYITYFTGEAGRASLVRWDLATRSAQVVEREAAGLGAGRYPIGRSPDGRYRLSIYSSLRRVPAVLFSYDTTTGRETELFRSAQANAFDYEDGLQWMPDGRGVLVNVRGSRPNAFELWWIPVDGRQPKRIDIGVDNLVNSAIAVHPDGRQIAFLAGDPIPSTASSPRREFRLLRLAIPDTTKHDIP